MGRSEEEGWTKIKYVGWIMFKRIDLMSSCFRSNYFDIRYVSAVVVSMDLSHEMSFENVCFSISVSEYPIQDIYLMKCRSRIIN